MREVEHTTKPVLACNINLQLVKKVTKRKWMCLNIGMTKKDEKLRTKIITTPQVYF
jgi:hypothetical protein